MKNNTGERDKHFRLREHYKNTRRVSLVLASVAASVLLAEFLGLIDPKTNRIVLLIAIIAAGGWMIRHAIYTRRFSKSSNFNE